MSFQRLSKELKNYFGKPNRWHSSPYINANWRYELYITGGRIRAQVAQVPFDEFHKHSAEIIQTAVFGVDKEGNLAIPLKFSANNLVCITVLTSWYFICQPSAVIQTNIRSFQWQCYVILVVMLLIIRITSVLNVLTKSGLNMFTLIFSVCHYSV